MREISRLRNKITFSYARELLLLEENYVIALTFQKILHQKRNFRNMKMKDKIIYFLNLIWTSVIAFSFPICFELIFLDITGHSKGYSYDLGSEKDISILLGCIELVIWSILALPSIFYVFRKTKIKGIRYLFLITAVYLSLSLICIMIMGGFLSYLKEVFNI